MKVENKTLKKRHAWTKESHPRGGRPKGSFAIHTTLMSAIKEVEGEQKVSVLAHFVRRAMVNDQVLVALLKKMVPDRQHVEGEISANGMLDGFDEARLRAIVDTCRKGLSEKSSA